MLIIKKQYTVYSMNLYYTIITEDPFNSKDAFLNP